MIDQFPQKIFYHMYHQWLRNQFKIISEFFPPKTFLCTHYQNKFFGVVSENDVINCCQIDLCNCCTTYSHTFIVRKIFNTKYRSKWHKSELKIILKKWMVSGIQIMRSLQFLDGSQRGLIDFHMIQHTFTQMIWYFLLIPWFDLSSS